MLIDLSHRIHPGMRPYPGLEGPRIDVVVSRAESAARLSDGVSFEISTLCMVANTGTYIDSPFHYFATGPDIADLEIQRFADLPMIVIDVGPTRAIRATALDTVPDVRGHAVVFRTGWWHRWGTAAYEVDSPFLTRDLVARLIAMRPALVGIDALNVNDIADASRPAHHGLLGAGIPIVEHLTRLARLPVTGARFTAAPAPVEGMGTMPVRAFAVCDD